MTTPEHIALSRLREIFLAAAPQELGARISMTATAEMDALAEGITLDGLEDTFAKLRAEDGLEVVYIPGVLLTSAAHTVNEDVFVLIRTL